MKKWNFYTTNEIKPAGWLKNQLIVQSKGLSGNLDKMWRDIKESKWIGGEAEGWERVPYWLDGFIPLAYLLEDEDMMARAKKYIYAIIDNQKPDGWICPCEDNERSTYDTWAVLLITKVLTVYYNCSKDERIPGVIYKTLKNYYELLKDGTVKLFDWGKYRWYEGFIAISFLYERYREPWLEELSEMLQEQGMDYNTVTELWKRPLNAWNFDTHLVNIAMMMKSEAVSADMLGKPYIDKAEELYNILKMYNGTPVETFTGDECLSGISPIQGTELCSVVELMYSYELLYAYSGDKKWLERLEVIAFNALPAAISDDMWTHQYDQQSNQIACQKFEGKPVFRTNNGEAHLFGLEPHYGCCTANFSQGWPKFVLSAFMYNENTIINTIPVPVSLDTGDVRIKIETNYPFENTFSYVIESSKDFEFLIRIPSFAENITVDGNVTDGFEIKRTILKGQKLEINIKFATKPFFEERPNALTTVKYGSLVFSVPVKYRKKMYEYEKDGVERKYPYCDYEYIPESAWNYAYCDEHLEPVHNDITDIPFSSEKPPVTIKAKAKKIDWGYEDGYDTVCQKLPDSRIPISEAEVILLYPYGAAKLRMTEIPKIY